MEKDDSAEKDKGISKVPTFATGSRKLKDPKRIYDALKEPKEE